VNEADRHLTDQVVILPFKDFMGANVNNYVEIARLSAPGSSLALAGYAQLGTAVHPGWNLDFNFSFLQDASFTAAPGAVVFDNASFTVTFPTGLNTHKLAKRRIPNNLLLSGTSADIAGLRLSALSGSCSFTLGAFFGPGDIDKSLLPMHSFF
jgi:hypothetical protein